MKLGFLCFIASSFLISLLIGCAHKNETAPVEAAKNTELVAWAMPKPAWIVKSDQIAMQFSKELAAIFPEAGSELGLTEFDSKGVLLDLEIDNKVKALFKVWIQKLADESKKTTDIELKTDFEVFTLWIQSQIDNIDTSVKEHEIEFAAGTQNIFQYMQVINNPQSPADRKKASIDRFKVYVHGDDTHRPLLEAMEEKFNHDLKSYKGKKQFLPYRGEVTDYLKETKTYQNGIKEMLKDSGRYDWGADWDLFVKQALRYDTFVKKTVLANSRKNARLPEAVYEQILKRRAIHSTAKELIQTGTTDYKKLYVSFAAQAKAIATKNNLKDSSPAAVIRFLKSKPVTTTKEVEQLYHDADQRLDKIMRDNNLISVPKIPLRIRIAGDAESKATPVPHLQPPPLMNNRGERPEFIVPSSTTGLPFDDFSSPASAMALTAHEGRPGHDMQFSQMLEKGISFVRGTYAANNVNIEGWALYAEDLVYPYLNDEEKMFAMQLRLWRMARMFLDPQIQLGQINGKRVLDLYTKELGVSKAMAQLELRRYEFADVGQAPSYYEGFLMVQGMKTEMQNRMKEKFNLKCFNDTLLSYGLLPLKVSAERMKLDNNLCDTKK